MNEIHLLTQNGRELFFRTAADIQNTPFEIIEKDFLVVCCFSKVLVPSPESPIDVLIGAFSFLRE